MKRSTIFLVSTGAWLALMQGTSPAAEASLGRLFFSPERRAALERQRLFNVQETQTLQGSSISLDGVIRRSDGDRTLWINGQAQRNNENTTGVNAIPAPRDPARVSVHAEGEAPAELKVGESINRATREKQDGLGGGSLVVGKPARRP